MSCQFDEMFTAVHFNSGYTLYTVSKKKKRPKRFFVISLIKLGQWHLVRSFLNKFAAKLCKRFPPHLNSVSTLPCETWNAHRARATIELLDRETPEFIQPQLWPPNSPDLNPIDNIVLEMLQERCTKHASVICSYRRCQWRMAATMTTWSSLVHSILSRCFSSSWWCVFCTPSLAVFPHAEINWIQIWRIWRPQSRWYKFWSFFHWQCKGSTCMMNIWSFTR